MTEKESCFHAKGSNKAAANGNRKTVKVRQGWGRAGLYSRISLNLENTIKNKVELVDSLKMAIKMRLNNRIQWP